MPERTVTVEARKGVGSHPGRADPSRERLTLHVDRGHVEPAQRPARERLEPVVVASRQRHGDRHGVQHEAAGEARARDLPQEGRDAVAHREGAVDVEGSDGGTRARRRCRHPRSRLYTRTVSDGPEIFDDLYLGLQAGSALRKQRRGEELTEEEVEALGRWQRLSVARKAVAIGAFAFGTFGLGFLLGGLVFGRRARRA